MRTTLILGFVSVAVTAGFAYRTSAGQAANLPCLAPGLESADRIQAIKENLAGADSASIRWRNSFGMAGVDSAAVAVVNDTLICTAVTGAVDSAFHEPPSTTAYLVVLRVGPRYIAFAPRGRSQSLFMTDTNYVWKHFVP